MLPHINGQQGGDALIGQRRFRVAGADDANAAVGLFHQPGPTGTEVSDRRLAELFFELLKGAKCAVNRFGHSAFSLATAVGAQAVPVERVVPHLGGIVEDATAGGFYNFFKTFAFKLSARNGFVEVVDIGLVVFAVMKLKGLLGNVRRQSVFSVRQCRYFNSHNDSLLDTVMSVKRSSREDYCFPTHRAGPTLVS